MKSTSEIYTKTWVDVCRSAVKFAFKIYMKDSTPSHEDDLLGAIALYKDARLGWVNTKRLARQTRAEAKRGNQKPRNGVTA